MVAPLSAILLCNYILFGVTVVHIHRVTSLHASDTPEEKSHILVYVKLSSMTGAFWLIAIVAEAIDNDAMRYENMIYRSNTQTWKKFENVRTSWK